MTEEERKPTASEVATNIFSEFTLDTVLIVQIQELKNNLSNEKLVKINEQLLTNSRKNNKKLLEEMDNIFVRIDDPIALKQAGLCKIEDLKLKVEELLAKYFKCGGVVVLDKFSRELLELLGDKDE
jgi:hypothetical protein